METEKINRTVLTYKDRESKARFVFEKYKEILKGKILDVGADQGYLLKHLPKGVEYTGIGFSDKEHIQHVDLEKDKIPFDSNSFDCVLCLDVLEHLENIHEIFDELCRVTRKWVIISLPNPWAEFMSALSKKPYSEDRYLKFYGLPKEKEEDRHKWFFSASEAKSFVSYRAKKNGFELFDLYVLKEGETGIPKFKGLLGAYRLKRFLKSRKIIFRSDLKFADLYEGTQWYVLKSDDRN